jgi:hypothetical protein
VSFISDIQKLQKVPPFEGGNERQRNKLNKVVDNQSAIIDAANRNADQKGAGATLLITVVANGGPTDVNFTAQIA